MNSQLNLPLRGGRWHMSSPGRNMRHHVYQISSCPAMFFTALSLLLIVAPLHAQMFNPASPHIPLQATGWTLLWSDEFSGSSVDTTNWTYDTGAGGWGNNELENYT